nr:MAG TPA: hypothetical protein [Caudoviricetes sp.]
MRYPSVKHGRKPWRTPTRGQGRGRLCCRG